MSWYKTGTIAVTNGSKIITGTGTQFTNPLNGVSAGRMLLLPAAGTVQIYEIASVQSDTQLTLVSAFTGTTGTGKAYAIPTSPAVSIEQFAHDFASTLAYYQQQLSGWQQILTGTGNVTLTTPDGQTVTVRSQQAWDAALDGKLTAGDYGIGGAVPKAITQQGMHFSYSDTVTAGTDLGLANNGVGYQSVYNTNRRGQIYQSFGDGQLRHRLSLSNSAADNSTAWRIVWDDANLSLANMYGTRGTLGTADLDTVFGQAYRGVWDQGATANATLARHYPIVSAGSLEVLYNAANGVGTLQRYTTHASNRVFMRYKAANADAWSAWVEQWTSDNLVKQTSQDDTTAGSVVINGGHGLGANARPRASGSTGGGAGCGFFSYTANHADNPFGGTGASGLHVQEAGTYGWDLLGRDGGGIDFRLRQISAGVASPWSTLWTSANLVKQTGPFDLTDGSMMINGAWGWGARGQVINSNDAGVLDFARNPLQGSRIFRNDTASTYTKQYGSSLMFKVADTWSILSVGYAASGASGGIHVAAGNNSGGNTVSHELWTDVNLPNPATLNTVQTVTAIKTHNAAVVTANAVAFRGTYTDGTVRNLAHINAQNIVHIGDGAAPTTIHGNAMPLIQVGAGTAYEIVDAGTSQTISGEKTFTGRSIFQNNGRAIYLVDPNITAGTLGRSFDISGTITGSDPRFVFAQRTNPGVGSGQTYVDLPVKNIGKVLVTNNNVAVDSNGFIKTASPVVKLFSNGTSELTSEAEGITTERLSEGVYRISGCLGLNADRAWGGDDGGIDVPMCRNKLPRLWVDYGGDEGSEQINPDGSIVIRTYHRPHPDAPAFARNEIDGYANGDPIDIPHDTFISVRVQMPEVEVQQNVVETVPNQSENDVVLETSTQA